MEDKMPSAPFSDTVSTPVPRKCQSHRRGGPVGAVWPTQKKRSPRKHTSQNANGEQQYFHKAMSVEEEEAAIKRVEEAQQRAKECMDVAILKRHRAQVLMENADLVTYLATMAVTIAESIELAAATMSEADASLQSDD